PNGAGKTTTVRILTTLLAPDGGRARVAGLDVVAQAAAVRRLIGLSGQYAAVDPYLTGRENLQMIGRLYGLGRRAARRRAGNCWSGSTSPRPATGKPAPTRAGCAAAWTSPPAWSPSRRCCSSTSRRPASTHTGGSQCGNCSAS